MINRKFYPWLVVALLWVVALLNYMDRQMLSTMQAEMKVDIVELQQAEAFGALMAVFLWVYGLVSPFAGIVADRISRKKLVVGSLFVWSLVTCLMGYASNFQQLYLLRALMGISEALYIPSALSLIADWHEGKSRSLAIGIHMTGLYVGQAVGGFGATVAAAFSWHATFQWFGIIGIVYSIVLLLLLHDKVVENTAGLVSPFAGIVADRISRKKLVVGSLFVWSLVTCLMGYASNFQQLYLLRALMGISEALYIPSALSLIADWHEGKSRSLAIGIHMTGLYVGQAVGGFGATVAAAFSWHATFQWFGIIGIVYSIVLLLLLHDKVVENTAASQTAPAKGGLFKGLSVVLSTWAFWVILFYFAVPSLPGWATKNWLPTLFSENLGIPMSQAGPMSTITIAISSLVGVIFGGILSDKWVQRNIRGRVYTSAIGLGMTIPALVLLGFGHSLVAVVGAGLLFGVGYGMFDANNMPILCQIISAKYRATAYGVMNMVGVFVGAMVTQVMGKCSDGGSLGFAFAVLGVVVVLALALQLVCLKPTTDNME